MEKFIVVSCWCCSLGNSLNTGPLWIITCREAVDLFPVMDKVIMAMGSMALVMVGYSAAFWNLVLMSLLMEEMCQISYGEVVHLLHFLFSGTLIVRVMQSIAALFIWVSTRVINLHDGKLRITGYVSCWFWHVVVWAPFCSMLSCGVFCWPNLRGFYGFGSDCERARSSYLIVEWPQAILTRRKVEMVSREL